MPIRWGIIGCGDIVRKRVAQAIQQQPDSQLLAACRRDQGKLDSFCREHQVPRGYTDANELLHDPHLDAVYLATPVNLHCQHALAAAERGKHVLVEKPMAMSVAQCEAMIDTARDRKVKLGVAYYRRFYPSIERTAKLIESGQIGRPLAVSAVVSNGFGLSDSAEGWRGDPSISGGGALMDIGSHRIDLFVKLFGEVRAVKSFTDQLDVTYEAENAVTLVCQFRNGVQATLQCFFGRRGLLDQFRVVGSDGRVDIENLNEGQMAIATLAGQQVECHPNDANLHAPLIQDFVEAIRDDRPPRCDGGEGMKTNRVIAQAYEDAREGIQAGPAVPE